MLIRASSVEINKAAVVWQMRLNGQMSPYVPGGHTGEVRLGWTPAALAPGGSAEPPPTPSDRTLGQFHWTTAACPPSRRGSKGSKNRIRRYENGRLAGEQGLDVVPRNCTGKRGGGGRRALTCHTRDLSHFRTDGYRGNSRAGVMGVGLHTQGADLALYKTEGPCGEAGCYLTLE